MLPPANPPTIPFSALARSFIARLPATTSAQIGFLREIDIAIAERRSELEAWRVPDVLAPRPAVGRTRSLEEEQPPPPPAAGSRPSPSSRAPRIPRPPLDTTTHVAGASNAEFRDGPALSAGLTEIGGCAIASDGVLYFTAPGKHCIRKLHRGIATNLSGMNVNDDHDERFDTGFLDGDGGTAQFHMPMGIALNSQGQLVVTDLMTNRIRAVSVDGVTTTLAGVTVGTGAMDGPAATFTFRYPSGICAAPDGAIYVTQSCMMSKISPDGFVSTLAGRDAPGREDGRGIRAGFHNPTGLALAPNGTLFVAGTGNNVVRKVSPAGVVPALVLGSEFETPRGVAVSSVDGTLFAAARDGV
jgi:sugar lactone lactonase YvrE